MTDHLPEYYKLLLGASQASEAVDNFDLRSEDMQSKKQFESLRNESLLEQLRLIQYIAENAEEVAKELLYRS